MGTTNYIQQIRSFNRFYTTAIGVVDRCILDSPYSLTEVRLLYEIYHNKKATARKINEIIRIDEGYLSRTVEKLADRGLINRKKSEIDGRVHILSLTTKGKKEFLMLNEQQERNVGAMIDHLSAIEKTEFVSIMGRLRELLEKGGRT